MEGGPDVTDRQGSLSPSGGEKTLEELYGEAGLSKRLARLKEQIQTSEAGSALTSPADVALFLKSQGFRANNPRMAETYEFLGTMESEKKHLRPETMDKLKQHNILVHRAYSGKLAIPEFPAFCEAIRGFHKQTAANHSGKNADYIPQLANADPEKWGVSTCTIHGQQLDVGDVSEPFSIQSTSKPITYGIALELWGERRVHEHVGNEPSGRSFNETVLKQPEGIPHNPLINAGAIMTTSFVKMTGKDTKWGRVEYVMDIWRRLCSEGSPDSRSKPNFQYATFLGEAGTATRNNSLAWMMEEQNAFPEFDEKKVDLREVLDAYFSWCSIELTCRQMAVVASTLANGGVNPLTLDRVFKAETVTRILSIMFSCGMYDYSGQFAYQCGVPAKSGVAGALMVVVPGVCGMATFSPRLDPLGNSVRGVEFCQRVSDHFGYHIHSTLRFGSSSGVMRIPPQSDHELLQHVTPNIIDGQTELFWASVSGDLKRISLLIAMACDVNFADYDRRTALHLAASGKQHAAVGLLLRLRADPTRKDRYENSPLEDATREGCDRCHGLIQAAVDAGFSPGGSLERAEQILFAHFQDTQVGGEALADYISGMGLVTDGRDPRLAGLRGAGVACSAATLAPPAPGHILWKALTGGLIVPNWEHFTAVLGELFAEVQRAGRDDIIQQLFTARLVRKLGDDERRVSALPEAEGVPRDTFSATAWSCDGQLLSLGESPGQACSVSSVAWPVVLTHLRRKPGWRLDGLMGQEPSGQPEDSNLLNPRGLPYNPFMVPGELVLCQELAKEAQGAGAACLADIESSSERPPDLQKVTELLELIGFLQLWRNLAGCTAVRIDEKQYARGWQNYGIRAILYSLLHIGRLDDGTKHVTLALWCALRAIQVTTSQVALIGATYARFGVHPLSQDRLFSPEDAKAMLSLMFACGADWEAGNAQFRLGVPVKTGRSGLCLLIVPGVLAVCALSPECHLHQNSLRGMAFLMAFARRFNTHVFERSEWDFSGRRWSLQKYMGDDHHHTGSQFLDAIANDDLHSVVELHHGGVDVDYADYDGRTGMHLAAVSSSTAIMLWLMAHGANKQPVDRWGRTPMEEAKANGHDEIVDILQGSRMPCTASTIWDHRGGGDDSGHSSPACALRSFFS